MENGKRKEDVWQKIWGKGDSGKESRYVGGRKCALVKEWVLDIV